MQSRKSIIYLIFAATVAYGFYFHFLSDRSGTSSGENESNLLSPAAMTGNRTDRPVALQSAMVRDKIKVPDWKRDPFRKTARTNPTVTGKNPSKNIIPDKPRVSAVSGTGGEAMVIADGRMLKIGEKIGPWKLVDVGNQAALFDGPGGRTWIRLGGSR
jgi:hypothetical protein